MASNLARTAEYVRVTKISGSYSGWLQALVSTPQNRASFLQLEKHATDRVFEQTAQEQYANNSSMLQRMLSDVSDRSWLLSRLSSISLGTDTLKSKQECI